MNQVAITTEIIMQGVKEFRFFSGSFPLRHGACRACKMALVIFDWSQENIRSSSRKWKRARARHEQSRIARLATRRVNSWNGGTDFREKNRISNAASASLFRARSLPFAVVTFFVNGIAVRANKFPPDRRLTRPR